MSNVLDALNGAGLTSNAILGMVTQAKTNAGGNLTTDNIPEGSSNLYFTSVRGRSVINATAPIKYNSSTGNIYMDSPNAAQLSIATLGAATHTNDIQEFINHSWSGGVTDGLVVTSNGNGTVAITAGEVAIRATNNNHDTIMTTPISAVSSLALTDNATNYVCVDYNAGSPIIIATTDYTTINQNTRIPVAIAIRVGNEVSVLNAQELIVSFASKVNIKDFETRPFSKARGGTVPSASGLSIKVSSGAIYFMTTRISHPAYDTTVAGIANENVFTYVYTGWNRILNSKTIDNTQYDNAGTLTTMPNNSYRTDFIYIVSNNPSKLFVLMGNTTYNKLTDALNAQPPTNLPPEIQGGGLLIGKTTVQKSATTMTLAVLSDTESISVPTQVHNELNGLQGGTTNEYYHLTSAQQSAISSGYSGTISVRKGDDTGAMSLTFTNGILTSVV